VPLNSALEPTLYLQNAGEKPITLTSENWRQGDRVTVTDEAGQVHDLGGGAFYSGWPTRIRWALAPGEMAEIRTSNLLVVADEAADEQFDHPVGRVFVAKPGKYQVRFNVSLVNLHLNDVEGPTLNAQGKADELMTGAVPLIVRPRTADDDARRTADRFTGRIEFVGADGTPVATGTCTVRSGSQRTKPTPIPLRAGVIEVPDCSPAGAMVFVNAAGFEEAVFYDVTLSPRATKQLELIPAEPARFRIVSASDGQPVSGAQVRYFLKNSEGASSGPYPTDGIEGPVWAVSDEDGRVVLDMLQKVNPYYRDLGDAVYFFFVAAPGLAGTFVGPVRAGQELNDVELGAPIEVRGEVRGTAEELDRFAAEWDQPYEVMSAGRANPFVYAVSQRLETKRDGDKLTFHLTGLRPGTLRFVCNFGPHPHSVRHTYSRRDPQGSDVVVGVELTGDVSNIVLTPKGRE
jgi:hypothetical protein